MEKQAFEFTCPICGSICQTSLEMRNQQMQCLICLSSITVPEVLEASHGLDIDYFVKAGVVTQRLRDEFLKKQGKAQPQSGAESDDPAGFTVTQQNEAEAKPERTERLLFRETVVMDGKKVPLAVSMRSLQFKNIDPIPVRQVSGVRMEVSSSRDSVQGAIEHREGQKPPVTNSFQITRSTPEKVARIVSDLLAALNQVKRPDTRIDLVDPGASPGSSYWDQLPKKS